MSIAVIIACVVIGLIVGFVVAWLVASRGADSKMSQAERQVEEAKRDAERITADARRQAETKTKEIMLQAKEDALGIQRAAEQEEKQRKSEISRRESRIALREDALDERGAALDRKEHQLSSFQGQLDRQRNDLQKAMEKETAELERIASLTSDQAHDELIERVRADSVREEAEIIRESEQRAKTTAAKTARDIITQAIQRCAADVAGDVTVTTVRIPTDDLKGRIIGREGRNIRTFEQVTGVSINIDDTPEIVKLSSFDPVRRETARVTMENLVADGRIHPVRIEEMYKKAKELVDQRVMEAGEDAAFDLGIHDLHPELVKTLGALKYRMSYGQNVLTHSKQVAELAALMASEIGADTAKAKRAGLLHDLGKAVDREMESPHAVIGAELARRYGEKPEVVHAIEAHHADIEPTTVLDFLVQAADAISASRPGARRETAEEYVKRMEKLESIANAHEGVDHTYAMQAGREVHVMVEPERIGDAEMTVLAHDITKEIEDGLEYPGQVRVVVIRESRVVDVAK